MVGQATTLCFFLLVAGWVTAVMSEEAHQNKGPPDLACVRGKVSICKKRCRENHPERTGYCKNHHSCVCITAPPGHSS
ncbi:longicornsin isoform X6 [Rhipicephalus microplus]|uniref:Putative male-specific defensin n=1 Tax=Rhipicephalus microplus TaxID=6941 RepID=A0A6M2CPL7_RHIMP